jgi:RNA polymerase sigma-54 factor
MKPALQFKLSQHLALTPQLQQSIRLLQLSTLELNQEIEQALADNPLLERIDDPSATSLSIAADGRIDAARPTLADAALEPLAGPGPQAGDERDQDFRDDARDNGAAEDGSEPSSDWSLGSSSGSRLADGDDDEPGFDQVSAGSTSLAEHLRGQLAATRGSQRDRALVALLIDELDDDGMLGTSVEEFHAALPAELEIDPDEVGAALKLLQSFDPPGVGARDLAECLTLQLKQSGERDPAVLEFARRIVTAHLELLAARDFVRLRRALGCDEEPLRAACALIRSLEPRPGARFAPDPASYVVPDVIVRRNRSGWYASLNAEIVPRLRVNSLYASLLRSQRGNGGSNLTGPLQEARWLVKNVAQRFETILRVAQEIVERQRGFFTHGAVAMRPLVLREIAEALDLHESTISRVTTQKYMLTPHGTFELKYFFGSHVATESGGAASSTAIRALIRQLISAENARRPLSDSRIAELLGDQGFVVARRTVAKYRESLRIPAVAQRRSL